MRIALVNMPWGELTEPSLGLSILKTCLKSENIDSKVFYFNLELLNWMKYETYREIADLWALCDFIFSSELDQDLDDTQLEALIGITKGLWLSSHYWSKRFDKPSKICDLLLKIRQEVTPKYIDHCAREITKYSPEIVGFTCLFEQTIPSIALAKKIKELHPNIKVVFGGYSISGETGRHILEVFPWIDHVHYGDGENAIVDICKQLAHSTSVIAASHDSYSQKETQGPKVEMDESPAPDYSDFYDQLAVMKSNYKVEIRSKSLSIESSRGCWWGQKNHCIFCGIDEDAMKYRARSPNNFISLLNEVRVKYNPSIVRVVDYILPYSYRKSVIPILENLPQEKKVSLTCEMKANLFPGQLDAMANAGFIEVQPGIESFSTPILRYMKKGVSAIQNVMFLQNAKRLGIVVHYNILYGFPVDTIEEYENLLALLPQLFHFDPPNTSVEVLITRNSPLAEKPGKFGIKNDRKYHYRYNVIFSEEFIRSTSFCLEKYCYVFEKQYPICSELNLLYRAIDHQVSDWTENKEKYTLKLNVSGSKNVLIDTRPIAKTSEKTLDDICVAVMLYIEKEIRTFSELREHIICSFQQSEFDKAIEEIRAMKLVFEEKGRIVGLVLITGTMT
ncbi:RiPP maturation radical SAM C-methyltransferase [Neptunomonas sp.]|uniref:RiPP maturation radical SAM C-methyltransferase n=1 Tax=Neptunomonas sp. TaxID=1971898 RepID=UPI0025D04F9B|nr:RiPP maturation radical SAM C-methyltransferase [Neptunomonas sp.]